MSRVAPIETSFNGGAVSKRLSGRIRQALYEISVAEMAGYAPMVEGTAEAMPGTIHVALALGPCRLFRSEYSTTQGHVLAFSDGKVQVFTNDALIATLDSPYNYPEVQQLRTHESFDVLYCFHPNKQPRKFVRNGAASFAFELLETEEGPFEPGNKNEGLKVNASALTGTVTLTASAALFAATDVGSLFRMEAEDFGDVTAWEPYITVELGQLLTWGGRVYRVSGGVADGLGDYRTGHLQPLHTEGVEWDGIGQGQDRNGDQAAGVQLEYLHDRFGVLRIASYVSATQVTAEVERHLPFSAVQSNYSYTGGYYDGWGDYVPPVGSVTYNYGTYRWAFGSFSDTRGWPRAGCIWDNRLCLAKDSTVFGSVKYDLENFAEYNELGDISADQAFIEGLDDPNFIEHLIPEERLLVLTKGGMHALGPSNAASGVGPGNIKPSRQNNAGCGNAAPVTLNGREVYIDRSGTRIYETDFDAARRVEQELDLARYARFMGNAGWVALAEQQQPFNHLWAVRADGSLTCASYLPEEQVLGWAERPMAEGMKARDLASITDPQGKFAQVWLAAEYDGSWHILRMAPWRLDSQSDQNACMVDMAAEYSGSMRSEFNHPLLPDTNIAVVADGKLYRRTTNGSGEFSIPPASRVVAGLEYPAWIESLDFEAGGDNGPAMGRKAKWHRAVVRVLDARGIAFGVPGQELRPLDDAPPAADTAIPNRTGYLFTETVGDWTRHPRLRIERQAPFQSTIVAWGGELSVEKH